MTANREERLLFSRSGPAGSVCSWYAAEMVTINRAVSWLADGGEHWSTVVVVIDNKSLLDGLNGASGGLGGLREKLWDLHNHQKTVTLLCVPGHCGLPGNEEADRLAGLGAAFEQANSPARREHL